MQLSQKMMLKDIELKIQTAFKFCMVLQTNRKKTCTEKIILVYIEPIADKHSFLFNYLVWQKEKKIGTEVPYYIILKLLT